MTTIFESIIWAFVIAALIYSVLEWTVIVDFIRDSPRRPVSGIESMLGSKALLIQPFKKSDGGTVLSGRVRIDGEDWKAEWSGECDALPDDGSVLTVVKVEPESLRVCVK